MGYIGAGISRFNTADELTVTGDAQIDTTTLVVDSTNNRVGVGTASPATVLDVTGNAKLSGTGRILQFDKNGSGTDNVIYYDNSVAANNLYVGKDSSNIICRTGGSEAVRIDSSQNLLVGKTSQGSATVGGEILASGTIIGMSIANIHTSQIEVDVQLENNDGDNIYIVKDAPIPVGSSLVVVGGEQKVVMNASDVLKVTSNVASSADVALSILEIT